MDVISFAINLMAATTLLMFSVHLVRNAVESRLKGQIKSRLARGSHPALAAMWGCLLAILMQGATAVVVLAASLNGARIVPLAAAIAIAVGADIGSAIVIRLLTLELDLLLPVLVVVGGGLKLRATKAQHQHLGQGILGIALVLISLEWIARAALPLREAAFLPALATYMQTDLILAVLAGMALTFALMSSVAAILFASAVFLSGGVTVGVILAFVIGANIGSGLIALWLQRGATAQERMLPLVNFFLRTSLGAVVFVVLVAFLNELATWGAFLGSAAPIYFHLGFNALLLGVLPFTRPIATLSERLLLPASEGASDAYGPHLTHALMNNVIELDNPKSAMRREILAMLDLVSEMLTQTPLLFSKNQEAANTETARLETQLNERMSLIRQYFSYAFRNRKPKQLDKDLWMYLEYAVRLEHAGDILSKRVPRTAITMRERGQRFTDDGFNDLMALSEKALANTYLAFEVATSESTATARDLMHEKETFSRLESKLRRKHFKRLLAGNDVSLSTSNHHLELSSCLKEVNSKVATFAYAVLDQEGELLGTRLVAHE